VGRRLAEDSLENTRDAGGTPGEASIAHSENAPSANGQRATTRQIDFTCLLCGQIQGIGLRRIETLAHNVCQKPLAELTAQDASRLIDLSRRSAPGGWP
jgi:hypothetical protein